MDPPCLRADLPVPVAVGDRPPRDRAAVAADRLPRDVRLAPAGRAPPDEVARDRTIPAHVVTRDAELASDLLLEAHDGVLSALAAPRPRVRAPAARRSGRRGALRNVQHGGYREASAGSRGRLQEVPSVHSFLPVLVGSYGFAANGSNERIQE